MSALFVVSGLFVEATGRGLSALFVVSGLVVTRLCAAALFVVSARGVEAARGVGAVELFASVLFVALGLVVTRLFAQLPFSVAALESTAIVNSATPDRFDLAT